MGVRNMLRRLIAVGLFLALLFLPVCSVGAAMAVLTELRSCKRIFAYSGRENAYFFGFSGDALVSERVLPGRLTRTLRVNGGIIAVCHDEACVSALYRVTGGFRVASLHMNDGVCKDMAVGEGYEVQASSFAAADGEAFVIVVINGTAAVLGTDGQRSHIYRFACNPDRLFVSDNRACVVLDDGSSYVLSGGRSVQQTVSPSQTEGTPGSGTLTAHTDIRTAVLRPDYTCMLSDAEQEQPLQSEPSAACVINGCVTVTAGTTVAALKQAYGVLSVFTQNGSEASGVLKTGFNVSVSGTVYPVAVTGDLDGSGTVSSRDIAALMTYIAGGSILTGCYAGAADVNGDGALNNRDLVLLVRTAG